MQFGMETGRSVGHSRGKVFHCLCHSSGDCKRFLSTMMDFLQSCQLFVVRIFTKVKKKFSIVLCFPLPISTGFGAIFICIVLTWQMSQIYILIIKVTISSIVIGLKINSYFPLIHLPKCYRTISYWTVCYWTVCNQTVCYRTISYWTVFYRTVSLRCRRN